MIHNHGFSMEEFDYLVNWVKELCDEKENAEFDSALLSGNSYGVLNHILSKLRGEVKSKPHPPNPRYEYYLDMCKKNPAIHGQLTNSSQRMDFLECTTDACLSDNILAVIKIRYPEGLHNLSVDTVPNPSVVRQSRKFVESENSQTVPLRNPLKDNLDDLSSKHIK